MRFRPARPIRHRSPSRGGRERGRRSVARRITGGLLGLAATIGFLTWGAGARGAGAGPGGAPDLSCTTAECHADLGPTEHRHRPVAEGACGICHRPVGTDRHEFRLARTGRDLCVTCHVDLPTGGAIHDGLGRDDCLVCHDAHGTGNRFMLSAPRIVNACEACHDDLLTGRSDMHLAVAADDCTTCHDPHRPGSAAAMATDQTLCLRCHVSVRTEVRTRAFVHAPAQPGQCDQCHDGHDSSTPAHLREDVPGLCFSCHEDIQHTIGTAGHTHSVAGEPGGCLVCHEPHASDLGFGLRADPFTLCGTCHAEEVTTSDGVVIAAVAGEFSGAFLHGPVQQRDCGACHDSHGSDHFRLLVDDYPAAFYARFSVEQYGLCFGCHPTRGILTPETRELTGFRDGEVNLHYRHVVKPDNGRTCRACHATHGSDAPGHIRPSVPFGAWDMPIDFEPTATGGSCQAGCHAPKSYDREVAVSRYAADAPALPRKAQP